MIPKATPPLPPSAPIVSPPSNACDSHFHIVAGEGEFERYDHRVEDPSDGTYLDWLGRLRNQMDVLGLSRGVVVQSILYGTDNSIVARTIQEMGADNYRGVAVVPDAVTDPELDSLRDAGIMGVRMNYVHGGVMSWGGAKAMANRLKDRGMHVQMLINSHDHMAELADDIRAMPVPVVLDHFGWPDLSRGVNDPGFILLRQLVQEGAAWVKLSGCFRFCNAPYDQADAHIASLAEANPERCLWGSDWPYLMMADAITPDPGKLLDALYRTVPSDAARQQIMSANPEFLYEF